MGYKSGSTGVATVEGYGSVWNINQVNYEVAFIIGNAGHGTLNILNGGTVNNTDVFIGSKSGSTGEVLVNGIDSTWTNNNLLTVGNFGDGKLAITGSGTVSSRYSYIGWQADSVGEVTVDGIDSIWSIIGHDSSYRNVGSLFVGKYGNGTLNIINGGKVIVETDTWLASGAGSSGTINFENGTLTTGGFFGNFDDLTGTGTLNLRYFNCDRNLVFDATHGTNQTFMINDNPNQNITVNLNIDGSGPMGVGFNSVGTMSISDGIAINSTEGNIGYNIGSTGEVTVDGAGSKWISSENLNIGTSGRGTLNITNGGVIRSNRSYIGYNSDSTGDVIVDGVGSTWAMSGWSGELSVGHEGNGTLSIMRGGAVSDSSGYIGYKSASSGEVIVDGVGSKWTHRYNLLVGYESRGTLNVINGGAVTNGQDGIIGFHSGVTGEITIDGVGSIWTNNRDLIIGYEGNGTLNITDGSKVIVKNRTWIAKELGSSGTIHFDNGTLTTASFFGAVDDLTGTGTVNTLGLVSDVDLVFDATHGLQQTFSINNNPSQNITVNLNANNLGYMGAGYRGNGTMSISDGVVVMSIAGYIGFKPSSMGVVTVDGAGSKWKMAELRIGNYGTGTMNITNGGVVSSGISSIGYESGSSGEVTVDGEGSNWSIGTYLSINNGTLKIINGGTISNQQIGQIGNGTGTTGKVTVDGEGSVWRNSDYIYVNSGAMNIINGGKVINYYGHGSLIGGSSGSPGTVTVDGIDSTWSNRNALHVGSYGKGTLNITNGGLVSVGETFGETLTIDYYAIGDSFINMASGGMLALMGDADDSLSQFLDLIDGTDAIRYWDASAFGWADITGATIGEDYTLSLGEGDLLGYTVLTVLAEVTILGDINGDGVVDGFDVDSFVDVLLDGGYQVEADANQDGVVNGFDVDPFVALVLGGDAGAGGVEVPEPMTLVLMVGGVGMVRRRKTI